MRRVTGELSAEHQPDRRRNDERMHGATVAHSGANVEQEAPLYVSDEWLFLVTCYILNQCSLTMPGYPCTVGLSLPRYAGCEIDFRIQPTFAPTGRSKWSLYRRKRFPAGQEWTTRHTMLHVQTRRTNSKLSLCYSKRVCLAEHFILCQHILAYKEQ